jgi:two-component system, LytTR family, sensor kinase
MNERHNKWFWPIQIFTWITVGLVNFIPQHIVGHGSLFIQYFNFLSISIGGFLVTSVYRYLLKKYNYRFTLKLGRFIGLLLVSTLIQTACWLSLILLVTWPIAATHGIDMHTAAFNLIPLWAIILIWNLVYLSYHLLRQYHTTEVEKWKLEAEVQKASLGNLKSQINPHFMFNALNNIRALILEDPNRAREMLTQFSETFRYALQHSENSETTVAKELSIVKQYLALVGIQYEEKMQYTIDAEDSVMNEKIPPMILQLLIENAVKHGIALSPTGGLIAIDIRQRGKQLVLMVKNTGTLKEKNQLEDSLGIGLNNVTKRLKLLYDNKANLKVEEQPPFVVVTISIEQL